jgi:steroid delta-isomerase-like uncharacterized protein
MTTTTDRPATRPLMSDLDEHEQRNLETVLEMVAQLNAHNPDGMLATMTDDMEWFDVPMEKPYKGKEEIADFLDGLFQAFPDLRYEPTGLVVQGDNVSVEFRMYGTHKATFYGLPATNKLVQLPCHTAITMRNGKIRRDDCYFDNAMILRQMGLMPPLSATLSKPGRGVLWLTVKARRFALPLVALGSLALVVRRLVRR